MTILFLMISLLASCGGNGNIASENCATRSDNLCLLSLLPYHHPEPTLNPSWNAGTHIQPALELAKDQINNSSLLENYTLNIIYAEAGCNQVGRTTVSFVMHAGIGDIGTNVVGIIGPPGPAGKWKHTYIVLYLSNVPYVDAISCTYKWIVNLINFCGFTCERAVKFQLQVACTSTQVMYLS